MKWDWILKGSCSLTYEVFQKGRLDTVVANRELAVGFELLADEVLRALGRGAIVEGFSEDVVNGNLVGHVRPSLKRNRTAMGMIIEGPVRCRYIRGASRKCGGGAVAG